MRRIASFALAAGCLAQITPAAAGAQSSEPARGLWIGPIQVCRDTAENARTKDEGHFASLIIRLRPELRAQLRRETERLVGSALPIRLDGKVISAPTVLEPITGGALSITGVSAEETRAIRVAIRRPC